MSVESVSGTYSTAEVSEESLPGELLSLREQIDRIDESLVLLLANRFALTRRVGELKAVHDLDACDPERESLKLQSIEALCEKHGVSADLVGDILAQVMREVVENHRSIRLAHKEQS